MSKKFEQLLEYVVNDDMDKAQAMFHEIVVAKSREIYENLIADEADEQFGGDQVEEFVDSIEADDAAIGEEELMGDEEDMDAEDDIGDDMADDEDNMHGDEEMDGESNVEDMEDRLVDLEDALSQLKAEFDSMVAGDAHDEEDADMHDHEDSEEADDETADEMDEDSIFEYKEHAPKPVLSEPAGTHATSPLAKNAKSPTGAGKPVVVKDGAQGNHGVRTPGKLTSYDTKGEGTKMKKVQDMKKV